MTSLTTSHPTNATAVTTPESTPRQGRPGITARWTRWVLVGTVSVGLVGAAAGLGYRSYEHSRAAAAQTGGSAPSAVDRDAGQTVHGTRGTLVTSTGVSATRTSATDPSVAASDIGGLLHGTRGALTAATGQPAVTR